MNAAMVASVGAGAAIAAAAAQLDGVASRARRDAVQHRDGARASLPRPALPAGPLGHALVAIVAGCMAWLTVGGVPSLVIAGCAWGGSVYRTGRGDRAARRDREQGAPAFARALADALRGGASVRSALADAARDRSVPIALRRELIVRSAGVTLGASVERALTELSERGGPGLRLLCGTIVMHLEAGGALAGQLDRLAADAEVAMRVDEDRVSATAQARATVRVVAALPVLALIGAEITSSHFLGTIAASTPALALLICGFVLEVTAILAARAIVGRGA